MSDQFHIAAQQAADELNAYEVALDQALLRGVAAIARQVEARQVGRLNIRVGQTAVEKCVGSTTTITQIMGTVESINIAIRDTIAGHRVLDRLAPELGLTIEAGGDKYPRPDPGGDPYSGGERYPLPPAAAADASVH